MSIPIKGIFINGYFYQYVVGSYSRNFALKNHTTTTQSSKTVTTNGADLPIHTVGIQLDNNYNPLDISTGNLTGATTWLGVSRLAHLVNLLGNNGSSMPLTLVVMDGSTHLVVPTNSIDSTIFNPDAPSTNGIEYRVSLTFENIQ